MTNREQEVELLYLRWWHMKTKHAHGSSMDLNFEHEMGAAVPERYKHKSSVSYVSKNTYKRKKGGRNYGKN